MADYCVSEPVGPATLVPVPGMSIKCIRTIYMTQTGSVFQRAENRSVAILRHKERFVERHPFDVACHRTVGVIEQMKCHLQPRSHGSTSDFERAITAFSPSLQYSIPPIAATAFQASVADSAGDV